MAQLKNNTTIGGNTFTVGTSTYFVSSGNIGIGTSSPTSRLHVVGDISVDNITVNNTLTVSAISAGGSIGSANQILTSNGSTAQWANRLATIGYTIDGGGSTITTGVAGSGVRPSFNCTIQSVSLISTQTGNIVVDIWSDTFNNYPPTVSKSITANATPTINSSKTYEDTTLTGWNTTINAGNVLLFNVNSCSNVTTCSVLLSVIKRN